MWKLRNRADIRTVTWVAAAIALAAFQYTVPVYAPYLCVLACYLALSCGVIAHNHNHCPTFKSKKANFAFSCVLSVFYGYPTFAWIPTHNLNHHKLVNGPGDATATWRFTNKHNAWVAGTYFFVSSYYQGFHIKAFIERAKQSDRALYRRIQLQYLVWAGTHVLMIGLGVALYGVLQGLLLWVLALGFPMFVSLWTIMLFNYDQHVHTDPWSKYAHSRSFVGKSLNFFLFNNGFHYVHHENPGTHWSKLPALHRQVAHLVPAELQQRSLWWYWFKQYALTPFFPKLGTVQMGRGPHIPPSEDEAAAGAVAGSF